MRRLIVLRPEPGASETLCRARKLGLEALSVPLFAIEPLEWRVPAGSFDGLLLTSANAVRHAGAGLDAVRALPVYAVGEATAAAARDAGLAIAAVGDSGVEALLGAMPPELRLIHLCGEDRVDGTGSAIVRIPVYRARPTDDCDLSGARDSVALVHSPRAGRRLAELVAERGSIAIAAISAAAGAAAGDGWQQVAVAGRPSDEALLALAARLCNKPGP